MTVEAFLSCIHIDQRSIDYWIYGPLDSPTLGSIDTWIHRTLDPSTLGSMEPWIHPHLDPSTLGSIELIIFLFSTL